MFTNNTLIASLTVILTVVTIRTSACKAGPSTLGEITEDAQIKEGTKFVITCNLKKLSTIYNGQTIPVNSSNIFFRHDSSDPIKPQIISERSAQIEITEARVNNSGKYFCYVDIQARENPPLVCYMELIVGQPPKELDGIHCVSEHYQNLTCVWNPPDHNIETTYTLSERDTMAPCPHRLNQTACQWTLTGFPHYRQSAHWIRLILDSSNKFGNRTQYFDVNNFAIIRPPPLERLTCSVNVAATSIELVWEIDPTLDLGLPDGRSEHPVLEFQVIQEDAHSSVVITDIKNPVKRFTATNLIPATIYMFKVRSRTTQSNSDDYWSENTTCSVATTEDVPYQSPQLFTESFDSVVTKNDTRSITLFWKPVDGTKFSNTFNSNSFRYVIEWTLDHIDHIRTRREVVIPGTKIVESRIRSITIPDLARESAYNFRIRATNNKGPSTNFTQMTIDKESGLPPKPKNIQAFSYGQGRYELRWDRPPSVTVHHYVISWCRAAKGSRCAGPMETKRVHANQSNDSIHNTSGVDYNFAVSSVVAFRRHDSNPTTFSSSGNEWATCVVPVENSKPGKLIFSLSTIGTNSLLLSWKLSCPGLHVVISKFEIIYCRLTSKNGSCIKKENPIYLNSTLESYTLKGLQQDAHYQVWMRMWNDGTAGDFSDPLEARTGIETDFTFPIIIGVLALVMTVLMIAICRKLFLKFKKDFNDIKQAKIEVPGTLGDSYNLTKTILGQTNGSNGIAVVEHRKNSGGSAGSNASSTGLITPSRSKLRNGNAFDFNGTEMMELRPGETTDNSVRETCPDDNSNTSHDSGLGRQSNGHIPVPMKPYVAHDILTEMSQRSTKAQPAHPFSKGRVGSDGSQTVICQINDGSSQFTPSSVVPTRVRQGYVQV